MAHVIATNRRPGAIKAGPHYLPPNVPVRLPLEFLGTYGQLPGVEWDFSEMAANLLDRNESGAPVIDWTSPLSGVDGYGRHAVWLIRSLLAQGAELRVHDAGLTDTDFLPTDIRELTNRSGRRLPARTAVTFTLGFDPALYNRPSPIRIAITQFETDTLPRVHAQNINRCHHVLVTSSFQVGVFRKSGVTMPISVMTPGIDVDYFPLVEREKVGLFRVLLLGALSPRKNPAGAIRVFQGASDNNPDWRLTIKTRHSPGIDQLRRMIYGDPRIQLVVGDDSPDESRARYYEHDCFLWLSKGEGVGLPPMEAMATGMEVVCSDNSGMSDYLNKRVAWPVRTDHMESAVGPGVFDHEYVKAYGDVGKWWVPNEAQATAQLRRAFAAWYEGKGKGALAAAHIRNHHTSAHSARDILAVVEQHLG